MSKYNWIVGINRKITRDEKVERELDFIIQYTDVEADNFHSASIAASNQLWETSDEEACKMYHCESLAAALKGAGMRAKIHPDMTVHKFYSECEWSRDLLEIHIKSMSIEDLENSRLHDWT